MQWLVTVVIAICLPLQAVSASVSALLGARHTHSSSSAEWRVPIDPQDSMSGWQDFRRIQYGYAKNSPHYRAHESGVRHHHGLGDSSVIPDDASDLAAHGASTDASQASALFIFMPASRTMGLEPPLKVFALVWGTDGSEPFAQPDPWRIERPPQALAA